MHVVPKNIILDSTHYFIMKITNKWELKQTVSRNSSDIDFKVFMNLQKKCAAKPYSFLFIDATLESDSSLRFRKNLIERISKLIVNMIKLKMKCQNMILMKKQQKYQHYDPKN